MLTAQFGVFWIVLLCCCYKSEAKLLLKNRTCVALAGEAVIHRLEIMPDNSTEGRIRCFHNSHQVWEQSIDKANSLIRMSANIIMHNSSCSGEYYFEYMNEKQYWVVLVRESGFQPNTMMFAIHLLVVISILLLLSVIGSVYIYKWYKNHSPSEGDGDKVKAKKRKRNTVATVEGAMSESVYTALQHNTVSVYDVLNVDEAKTASTESQTSKKKVSKTSKPVEEGIFESVYENL
ncbi:hypothetical protein KOW79_020750 [Hemibagrus wyckioides]|uniref:Uncharacterized protein n=1 Tax=Hemibagrus wyckioides TaxID=337641 RepID=A0A9D3N6Y2_9TELE|nr:uncharacterized protein si:ch211-243a20.4 [Hemibagrus wyckioides]KAG7315884.1 hypothetical protein KOW79_020750 [Hemibagrus wyckioides]